MKKIKDWKKFENSQDEDEFDYEYVKQCFIDLIESDKITYIDDDFVTIVVGKIPTPTVKEYRYDGLPIMDIDRYIKDLEETKEIMLDLNKGMDRVKDEYPDYKHNISYDDGLEYGELVRNPTIKLSIWEKHH